MLLELRSSGLKIVFTSNVVRQTMVVETEPVATEPWRILDEILTPHGLEARNGPGGTIVIVPGASGESEQDLHSVRGFIGSKPDAAPVAGAVIRVVGLTTEVVSDENGRFTLPHSGDEPLTLEVRLKGFVVERFSEIVLSPGPPTEVTVLLDPAPILEEEVVVTPSRVSLLRDTPLARLNLNRQEILSLPHLGGDLFRA
ncbi:MAG: carboxypeptidase-like regulatory domain-containing protein, partial [Acidobacteriota bacterium]|nr:carboxypeptidase-like regulatory domain-containing protein [Acidobacteriota bacterium]